MGERYRRLVSLFIVVIMVGSGVGYAIIYQVYAGVPQNSQKQQAQSAQDTLKKIIGDGIVARELSASEKAFVLQSGITLLEDFESGGCFQACLAETNCLPCQGRVAELSDFAKKYAGFVVLEQIISNESSARFIGSSGRPHDIEKTDETSLLDTFCSIAAVTPKDCLVRSLVSSAPSQNSALAGANGSIPTGGQNGSAGQAAAANSTTPSNGSAIIKNSTAIENATSLANQS